jgi:hypothetical protein
MTAYVPDKGDFITLSFDPQSSDGWLSIGVQVYGGSAAQPVR